MTNGDQLHCLSALDLFGTFLLPEVLSKTRVPHYQMSITPDPVVHASASFEKQSLHFLDWRCFVYDHFHSDLDIVMPDDVSMFL